jgi:hypothetical protein
MIRVFLFLSLVLNVLASPVHAAEARTVVLLTSVNLTSVPFRKEYWRTYHLKLEETLKEEFADQPFKIKTIHYAKQDDLWKVLHDPENIAVFWVSHGGYEPSNIVGISDFAVVVDEFGYDLAPIFNSVHPHLRFLGIIGCLTQKVVNFKPNPLIDVMTFDIKTNPMSGLEKAIARSKVVLRPELLSVKPEIYCHEKKFLPVVISRTIPQDETNLRHPPVRIMQKDRVLGVFPTGFPGDIQFLEVELEAGKSLNLSVSAGSNPMLKTDEISLGKFEFSAGNPRHFWKLFSLNIGIPIGVSTYAYDYVGMGVNEEEWQTKLCDEAG